MAPRFRAIDEVVGRPSLAADSRWRLTVGVRRGGDAGGHPRRVWRAVVPRDAAKPRVWCPDRPRRPWTDIAAAGAGEAGQLVVLGLAIGTGLALAGKRVLEGMLFGIGPRTR